MYFQFRVTKAEGFSSSHCFPGDVFGRTVSSRTGLLSLDPSLVHFHARVAHGIFMLKNSTIFGMESQFSTNLS